MIISIPDVDADSFILMLSWAKEEFDWIQDILDDAPNASIQSIVADWKGLKEEMSPSAIETMLDSLKECIIIKDGLG